MLFSRKGVYLALKLSLGPPIIQYQRNQRKSVYHNFRGVNNEIETNSSIQNKFEKNKKGLDGKQDP